jgi:hypothetical protein
MDLGVYLRSWLVKINNRLNLFFVAQQPLAGLGVLIIEASRSHSMTHAHTHTHTHTRGRTRLGVWSARRRLLYLTAHKNPQGTSMPAVGFEPTILAPADPRLKLRGYWESYLIKHLHRPVGLPEFLECRQKKLVTFSPPSTSCFYPPVGVPRIHFFEKPSRTRGHGRVGETMSMTNCNDTVG